MHPTTYAEWWRPSPPAGAVVLETAPAEGGERAAGRFAFGALVAFTIVLVAAPQEYIHALAPLRLAMIAAVLALVGHLANVMRAGDRIARRTPLPVKLAGALLAWTVLTIPLSSWPGGSVSTLSDVFIKSLIIFWLLGRVVSTVARLQTLATVLSLLSILLAITGIRNYLSGVFAYGRVVGYSSALAGNPNDLALMLNILLPLSIALVIAGRSPWLRLLAAAAAGLSVMAIIVTFSRGGFLALSIILVLSLFWLVRLGKTALVAGAIVSVLVLAPFTPAGYLERLQTVSDVDSDPTGSAQERWRDMQASVAFIQAHPIVGAGLGMDVLALNELRGRQWKSVHDVYLQYGVDLGLPGLLLFLALVCASISAAWRVERETRRTGGDRRLLTLAGAIRISLVAFAVAAIFYPVAYHFYFYYLAGLASAARTLGTSVGPNSIGTLRS